MAKKVSKRLICYLLLMLLINPALALRFIPGMAAAVALYLALVVFYICFNIAPVRQASAPRRLKILVGGYELALAAITCFTLEALIYIYIFVQGIPIPALILTINALAGAMLLFILLINGIIRIFTCSKQLGIMPRLGLLLLWWLPVVNILLLKKFLDVSLAEYQFGLEKFQLNQSRKQEQLCKTKYPLLMVHGIFFRDWQNFNYWGRIPQELTYNGATIYYGHQQSSAPVEQCADELKQRIVDIVQQSGCEKVNIIAHSKGGLDARYAISCLGMGEYVASLTTINTPHLGCNYVRRLLALIPHKIIAAVGKKYESIYTKMGDENPDFFRGLKDLTDKECARLNALMPDDNRVLYQSVGSRMRSPASAMFPLNLGYCLIKYFGGGENDGLVPVKSMAWGNFLGVLTPQGKRGIAHGDVIDLTRHNIEGFDVGGFYVDLVHTLKSDGF